MTGFVTEKNQVATLSGSGEAGKGADTPDAARFPTTLDQVGVLAKHNLPGGIAIDASGNLYVLDSFIGLVRRITPATVVRTVAGGSLEERKTAEDDDDDFMDQTASSQIIEDLDDFYGPNGPGVWEGTWQGFRDGRGLNTRFFSPGAVAIDSRNRLFIADTGNNAIRLVDFSSGDEANVSTYAGTRAQGFDAGTVAAGAARFNAPAGIAVDAGTTPPTVYVADTANHCIRKIDAAGNVSVWAGNGTAGFADGKGSAARFNMPAGLALDKGGALWVADASNNRIRRIDPDGNVTTIAGGNRGFRDSTGPDAQFWLPWGIALDRAGNLVVADKLNHRIRRVTPQGVVSTVAGTGVSAYQDGPASQARFNNPEGVAIDPNGNIVVTDTFNHRVRIVTQ